MTGAVATRTASIHWKGAHAHLTFGDHLLVRTHLVMAGLALLRHHGQQHIHLPAPHLSSGRSPEQALGLNAGSCACSRRTPAGGGGDAGGRPACMRRCRPPLAWFGGREDCILITNTFSHGTFCLHPPPHYLLAGMANPPPTSCHRAFLTHHHCMVAWRRVPHRTDL